MSKAWHLVENLKTRTWLVMVATVAVVERVLLYLSYRPVIYHDTGGYWRLAGQLLAGWDTYDGTRTPVYTAFLVPIGPDERVYVAQLVLGLATTLLFFLSWLAHQPKGLVWGIGCPGAHAQPGSTLF